MKKLLLVILVFSVAIMGYSQVSPSNDKYKAVKVEQRNTAMDDATNFANPVSTLKANTMLSPSETQIGITYYDLFSNYNVGNRFWVHEDGTMSAVWIYGEPGGASSFPGRGTGYNYYDGTAWGPQPTERIENTRTGWPNIAASGAGEFGVAHNGSAGLETIYRPAKGTGDWTQSNFLGPAGIEDAITWPRAWASGAANEYNHILVPSNSEYGGQASAVVYSRTMDGGATYDIHNIVPEYTGPDYYIESVQDRNVFASNGNTICFLYVSIETDLYYLRSDDNGENWERVIVWEFPIELYDPAGGEVLDTTFAPDMSAHLTIDDGGMVHVVFGLTRIFNEDGTGLSYFPYHPEWEGIVYWNDGMDAFSGDIHALAPPKAGYEDTELVDNETYIGWVQDVDGDGVITMETVLPIRTYGWSTTPSIHVDNLGNRMVVWAANTETYVYTAGTDPTNYKHIWGRGYNAATETWGDHVFLTEDISHVFDDCVYPMIGNNSDAMNFHFIYQADIAPGNALDGDHDYWENRWIHSMVPKMDLGIEVGIEEAELIDDSHVSQNFPNPFNGTTNVQVELENAANLSLVVTNMTGQKVIEINKGFVNAQTHTFSIDATNLQSGVYFYTVTAGDSQVTKKMIVE